MPEVNGKGSLEDRVNIILDELSLGNRWRSPCLIISIYRSEHIKKKVEAILAKSLGKSGQAVIHYSVDKLHYDIPNDLLEHPKHRHAVFYVSGLRRGGGRGYSNAYRALNMHRETLVEGKIRAIFWVTTQEAMQLARFSPDFWAFRHKVVEFPDLPSTNKSKQPAPSKSILSSRTTKKANELQNLVSTAEKFYHLGCMDEAIFNFRKALRKYPDETVLSLRIAEIYIGMGNLAAAGRILKKAGKENPQNKYNRIEIDRLNLAAKSMPPAQGGFLEY